MSYLYVACMIVLMVYAQVVIKWQVNAAGAFPVGVDYSSSSRSNSSIAPRCTVSSRSGRSLR